MSHGPVSKSKVKHIYHTANFQVLPIVIIALIFIAMNIKPLE